MTPRLRVLATIATFVVLASCNGSPCNYCPDPLVYSRPLTAAERARIRLPPTREQCDLLCEQWGPHFFAGDANRLDGGSPVVDAGYPWRIYGWLCEVDDRELTCRGLPLCPD